MRAKTYLSQIKTLDIEINNWIDQLHSMKQKAYSLSSTNYDSPRVQGTQDPDRIGNMVARIAEREDKINAKIDELAELKERITYEIKEIDDNRYVEILFRRYVQMQSLKRIAKEMGYSYERMRHLHGHALVAFESRHTKAHLDML